MSQYSRIDGVCFGANPPPLGEIPNLSRVDDGDGEIGIDDVADERPFVPAGGFDDDHLQSWMQL